jgi:hypothetical protein
MIAQFERADLADYVGVVNGRKGHEITTVHCSNVRPKLTDPAFSSMLSS